MGIKSQVKSKKIKVKCKNIEVESKKNKRKRLFRMNSKNDLNKRLFEFAVNTINFLSKQKYSPEAKVIREQLIKSSTSSGANYEESQAGSSKADFINKVLISLREMRESNYWLRLMKEVTSLDKRKTEELNLLISESKELKKILGAIVTKSRKNLK